VFYLDGCPWARVRLFVGFFWKSMNTYFSVQHRISCVRLQGSYMLESTLLQKPLYCQVSEVIFLKYFFKCGQRQHIQNLYH
jgi:hypothetical protein